jgi:hypothetical protein
MVRNIKVEPLLCLVLTILIESFGKIELEGVLFTIVGVLLEYSVPLFSSLKYANTVVPVAFYAARILRAQV